MMLERTFDVDKYMRVIRHPAVEPFVSLGAEIPDLTDIIENTMNYCLMNDHGGFLMVKSGDGQYDVHTAFLPEGRGPHLVDLAKKTRDFMFSKGAVRLQTFVAYDNKPARRLALAAGFKDVNEMTLLGVPGMLMSMERKDTCQ